MFWLHSAFLFFINIPEIFIKLDLTWLTVVPITFRSVLLTKQLRAQLNLNIFKISKRHFGLNLFYFCLFFFVNI